MTESMKRLQSNSERGNAESKLGNEQPFAIEVKGGGKAKKVLLKRKQRLLPSMPKGEVVGNVGIDGKVKDRSST